MLNGDFAGNEMENEYITPQQLAEELGCAKSTVTRRSAAMQIGKRIGIQTFFTHKEAEQLRSVIRPGQPGNPQIGELNRKKPATKGRKHHKK